MAYIRDHVRSSSDVASEILDRFWDGNLPIRPEVIARKMDVELVPRGAPGDWDYRFSGFFTYVNDRPVVEYNVNDPLVRRRFTVAHELGHFVLGHRDVPRDTSDFSPTSSPVEVQANQFAAELLMPSRVVQTMVMNGRTTVDQLANTFAVSKQAMEIRLANLSLYL